LAGRWEETKLGDVIELKRGFDLPIQDRKPGRVPVVSSSGITGTHSQAMVQSPGVVTGRYGTIGQVFYIEQDFWPLNTTLFVKDFKANDPRFISYFLRTIDFRSCSDKSSVPGVNRNDLHRVRVRIPPLSEQRAIAHILGRLDAKIELNRRMNETLEALARAIFKSWFVDFDPVRAKAEGRQPFGMDAATAALFPDSFQDSPLGKIPKGWRVCSLDEIGQFLNGLALQKYPPESEGSLPVIKIAQLRKGNADGADRASSGIPPEYVVHDGDVLFSWSGSLEVEIWCGGPGALNQHLFKVTSPDYPKWFYYYWIHEHLPDFQAIASGKATTMGHIQRHHLKEAKVLVPGNCFLRAMDRVVTPLIEARIGHRLQSRTLAAIRDTLLPKLISGEIRAKHAKRTAEML
jgi:type I restriction enzyme S subunit